MSWNAKPDTWTRVCLAGALLACLLGLFGWWAGLSILTHGLPGRPSIKGGSILTIVCLLVAMWAQSRCWWMVAVWLTLVAMMLPPLSMYAPFLPPGEDSQLSFLGRPSPGVAVMTFLLAAVIMAEGASRKPHLGARQICGILVTVLSVICLVGLMANWPLLYWTFGSADTGMGILTAMAFGLLGVSYYLLGRQNTPDPPSSSNGLTSMEHLTRKVQS